MMVLTDEFRDAAAPQRPMVQGTENAGALNAASPLSLLISRHFFQDGEIIELAIRPSAWWIIFRSWYALLVASIIALAGPTFDEYLPGAASWYVEFGAVLGMAKLMWETVRWTSRIHVLTNLRVMTISGVFNVTLNECPLRRLGRLRDVSPKRERLLMLGSFEVIPSDESFPIELWQTIRRPGEVQRKIRAAMERARGDGGASGSGEDSAG